MRALVRTLLAFSLVVAIAAYGQVTPGAGAAPRSVDGSVENAGVPLVDYDVTLLAAGPSTPSVLGTATTAADGSFTIDYDDAVGPDAVLYLRATEAPPALGERSLWSVLGTGPAPASVVINETTTVATAYAMAQFTDGVSIFGPSPGLPNAAMMAKNLADPVTGEPSPVLTDDTNMDTRTSDTFNSLRNAVVACLESDVDCQALFDAATSPEGSRPGDTYAAIVNIAHDPWHHIPEVFAVTLLGSTPWLPAQAVPPAGWTLALRFVGDGMTLDGPGNVTFDHRGHLWVNINYVYSDDRNAQVCGSNLLAEFLPDGSPAPGSPYSGGGLDGAGFGITRDPFGDIWVANFGFFAPMCPDPPPKNSISQFRPDGTAVSPAGTGWTQGNMNYPQTIRSDDSGNIWITNCGNGTVTMYPEGDPDRARNFTDLGLEQPFDIGFGLDGTAFVSGSASDTVAMIAPDGTPLPGSPISGDFLSTPMGVATDSGGNVWIANQGVAAPFCPNLEPDPGSPSIALLNGDGSLAPGAPFVSGGIRLPWGIAVDGNDNLWVADFGGLRVSQICGVPAIDCRPGTTTGAGISPDSTGYRFDGLTRNTGVGIDPSGNVWLMNNWIQDPDVPNPGGWEIVAFVGLGAPVQPEAPRPRPLEPVTPAPPTPLAPATAETPRFTG